jgi:predicted acylesterase/phospholipase RssA
VQDATVEHRRPLERLEGTLVRRALAANDPSVWPYVEQLRYVLSFSRLTAVRNPDGQDIHLQGPLSAHAGIVREALAHRLASGVPLREAVRAAQPLVDRTRRTRASVLEHMQVSRDALEDEITTRQLVVASGGGGGAGYVYPGAYDMLDRDGFEPSLLVGTSIGALMGMFRARRRHFDLAALVAAARALSWGNIFRVLETESRYGLPATLRLYLRNALGALFKVGDRSMWLSDTELPLYVVVTGLTVDALKHDLNYYETLIADDIRTTRTMRARSGVKAMALLREFLSNRNALREIVLGRDAGTEHFDVLDAAGFSAAIPGAIHYDVIRDDPRMRHILDTLYATQGITRLGEGGMVSNVPARIGWEAATSGSLNGKRNVFVVALDCFAPSPKRIAWFPFQQAVKQANVLSDRQFADLYVAFPKTLSPLNLVPKLPDAMRAIRWGRETMDAHMPFVRAMMAPIPVL